VVEYTERHKNKNMPGSRILMIEDEKTLNEPLGKKLTEEGFVVKIVEDADEAMLAIEEQSYDLILLDIIIPKLDGLKVLRNIREKGIETPVIVMSNLGDQESQDKAKGLGVVDYAVKANNSLDSIVEKIKKQI